MPRTEALRQLCESGSPKQQSKQLLNKVKVNDPSKQLLNEVKANFVLRGHTLGAWCRKNNVNFSNARQALVGGWDGPKAKELRLSILIDCGLVEA